MNKMYILHKQQIFFSYLLSSTVRKLTLGSESSQQSCVAPAELTSQTPDDAVQMSVSGQRRPPCPPYTCRLTHQGQAKPECTSAVQPQSLSDTSLFFLVPFVSKYHIKQPEHRITISYHVFTFLLPTNTNNYAKCLISLMNC